MFKEYESIHHRNGFLIKTNRSNDFYGPFKVAALPTKSDPPLAEWVSPIPLSGLFPLLNDGLLKISSSTEEGEALSWRREDRGEGRGV